MRKIDGFCKGMGIGGWLTNYKRFNVLPEKWRMQITEGDMEHFRTYITERDVENIKKMGFDHIRLGFDQIVAEESPYKYRGEIFDIIENFILSCRKYELNVVLNLHKAIGNYCDISEDVGLLDSHELQQRFIALWEETEKRFSGYNFVMFELLNELRDVDSEKWNMLAEKTINRIRSKNKTRKIIIGSKCWNSPDKLDELKLYDDENIFYTFHMYSPVEFTHQQGVLQPAQLYYNRKMKYPSDDIERYRDFYRLRGNADVYAGYDKMDINFLKDCMKGAVSFTKKHPDKILWCGEFGTIRHCDITSRENYMRDIIKICMENDIPYCVWNYLSTPNDGNRFSLVDDDTRQILSKRMLGIINGSAVE